MPRHRLTDIDNAARTATCAVCGPSTRINRRGPSTPGHGWRCAHPGSKGGRSYRAAKGGRCARAACTATIEHPAQLDVHHRDGDHSNNAADNLVTLCANCHRLAHT